MMFNHAMKLVVDSSRRHWVAQASVVVASAVLLAQPAMAVVVTIGGTSYDVLITNRSQDQEPTLFTAAQMPWFTGNTADPNLAYDFAQAVGSLGSNAYPGFAAMGGPLFAFATDAAKVYAVFDEIGGLNVQNEIQVGLNQVYNYAYVKPSAPSAPTSVPGPLPLAAAAMALGWSRQLRSRQRRSSERRADSGSFSPRINSANSGRQLGS